jgi:hypothetical protein
LDGKRWRIRALAQVTREPARERIVGPPAARLVLGFPLFAVHPEVY